MELNLKTMPSLNITTTPSLTMVALLTIIIRDPFNASVPNKLTKRTNQSQVLENSTTPTTTSLIQKETSIILNPSAKRSVKIIT